MNFRTLLRISRPRFWHYVLGPMLIYFASSGYLTDMHDSFIRGRTDWIFQLLILFIILGYFTLPANLWIYGWNDIADGDTDKFNSKKGQYEERIEDSDVLKSKLKKNIWARNIGYLVLAGFVSFFLMMIADCFPRLGNGYMCGNLIEQPRSLIKSFFITAFSSHIWLLLSYLIVFFITSYLYSCQPLRAKAKPFIDGIMNILYIATPFSIIVIQIITEYMYSFPSTYSSQLIIYNFFAAWFRVMAMHCYSAIPDIEPDRQAGLVTTAVYLGKQNSLIYCGILYLLSAIFSFPTLGWFSIFGGIIYLIMIIISYYKKDIFALYKLFPYINLIIGFLLFRYIILYS